MGAGRGRGRAGSYSALEAGRATSNGAVLERTESPRPRNGSKILHQPPLPGRRTILSRFGPTLGRRFSRNNHDLLQLAYAAYTGLRKSAKTIRGRGANIFTQWIGDPDALGSAVVLKAILEHLGAKEVRILTGALGHPQTRNLAERCHIELRDPNEDRLPRGLHCTVDTSPPLGMTNTGRVTPVSEYFFVADHHADRDDVEENCRARGVKRVRLAFVGLPVGSTSAFMAVVAAGFGILNKLSAEVRAAAALGIYTDTSALLHGGTPLDFRMFELVTQDNQEARDILDELRDYRVPPEWFNYRIAAFQNLEIRGSIRIAPVGYVREDHRDVIAEISNDLLRIENTSIGVAVAVTERGTEVSIRGDARLLGNDQQRIVRVIDYLLSCAFPGLSGFKHQRRPPHRVEGGACVPHSQAQERMWKLGSAPAAGGGDPVLEHCRACARALIAALEDLKYTRPEEIEGLL